MKYHRIRQLNKQKRIKNTLFHKIEVLLNTSIYDPHIVVSTYTTIQSNPTIKHKHMLNEDLANVYVNILYIRLRCTIELLNSVQHVQWKNRDY